MDLYITEDCPRKSARSIPDQAVEKAMRTALALLSHATKQADLSLYADMRAQGEIWTAQHIPPIRPSSTISEFTDAVNWLCSNKHNFNWLVEHARELFDLFHMAHPMSAMHSCRSCLEGLEANSIIISSSLPRKHTYMGPVTYTPYRTRLHNLVSKFTQDQCTWLGRSPPTWLIRDFFVLCTVGSTNEQCISSKGELLPLSKLSVPGDLYRFGSIREAQLYAQSRSSNKADPSSRKAVGPKHATADGYIASSISERSS